MSVALGIKGFEKFLEMQGFNKYEIDTDLILHGEEHLEILDQLKPDT